MQEDHVIQQVTVCKVAIFAKNSASVVQIVQTDFQVSKLLKLF